MAGKIKRIVVFVYGLFIRFPLMLKSLAKIYRNGGYSTIEVVTVNCGDILQSKNILITGGSSGIGYAIARKCVSEGARVLITGRNEEKLKKACKKIGGDNVKYLIWDVRDIERSDSMVGEALKIIGGDIDALVNNAGVLEGGEFPNVSEKEWDKVYSVNSKGLYFLTQSIYKYWKNNDSNGKTRKIINISSQGGFVGATYPYRMTKWDIVGLTKGLALKMAPESIIVNGIAPGIVLTNMQKDCVSLDGNAYYPDVPLERYSLPEEVAELALFLLSGSSNYIVGQTIICDGGFTLN